MAFYFCRVLPQPILNNKEKCDQTRGLKYCFQISFSCLIKNENLFNHWRIVITLKEDFTYYCQHIEGQLENQSSLCLFLTVSQQYSMYQQAISQTLIVAFLIFFVYLAVLISALMHAHRHTHTDTCWGSRVLIHVFGMAANFSYTYCDYYGHRRPTFPFIIGVCSNWISFWSRTSLPVIMQICWLNLAATWYSAVSGSK